MTATAVRTTDWVTAQLGVTLRGDAGLAGLVRLALRRNPRRAHLLVSTVLGKHVPVDPREVHRTGLRLGEAVGSALEGCPALVLGFAETATGLGHCVAEAIGAPYLHSTRRAVPGAAPLLGFREEHSHATDHRLLPADPALCAHGDVLVLVDDELSTGRTAMNTIAAMHACYPRNRYVIAALVDVRRPADHAALDAFAVRLGVPVDVVSLAAGELRLPAGFPAAAAAAVGTAGPRYRQPGDPLGEVTEHPRRWPSTVREGGRHGFRPADVKAARAAAWALAAELAGQCGPATLVLGTEELMYAPTLIGCALAERLPTVAVASTTRSPVHVVDEPGYPIRSAVTFPSHDPTADGPGPRFAYNLAGNWTDIVLVLDSDAATPELRAGLIAELRHLAPRVHVVVLPCWRPVPAPLVAPEFGSYSPGEVNWLLSDLSHVALEAPTEEREEAIQSGAAHYAESLPIEYQPDADYHALFAQALDASATRIAHAVGVVTELVLAERGPAPVLASLARAGTPVGVLMQRWARFTHGSELAHYAVSIVRGRGIDGTALRYLAQHHAAADVVFVDGWTGKGAIVRELTAAVEAANAQLGTDFDPALAVLADPGACVATFGTRDDFLIPSACLNSTVSGLVSRTVLNARLTGPGQYHGAKFYRELAGADLSAHYVDAISARFAEVAADVARDWPARQAADRTPRWTGWAEVERLCRRYGAADPNFVKPGVGETTRVLLRRVPEAVLVHPDAGPEIDHVRLLAGRRGVPVHVVDRLGYRCVGLVRSLAGAR